MIDEQPQILIIVYAGYDLVGDEAVLLGEMQAIRAVIPGAVFTVASGDPDATRKAFGVRTCFLESWPAVVDAIEAADVVVVGGGGVYNEYWDFTPVERFRHPADLCTLCTQIPLIAAALETPCVLYSIGVEPLRSEALISAVRQAFEAATLASVRDSSSAAELDRIGVSRSLYDVTCDPAAICPLPSVSRTDILQAAGLAPDRLTITATLRHWDLTPGRNAQSPQPWEHAVRTALQDFCRAENAQILFIPSQVRGDWLLSNDIVFYERFMRDLGLTASIYRGSMDPLDVLAAVSAGDVSIAMRHHGVIFAAATATPFLTLGYSRKAFGAAADAGMAAFVVDLATASAGDIRSGLHAVKDDRAALRQRLSDLRDARATAQTRAATQVLAALQMRARRPKGNLLSPHIATWLRLAIQPADSAMLTAALHPVFDQAVNNPMDQAAVEACLRHLVASHPNDPTLNYYHAICLHRTGAPAEAIERFAIAESLGANSYWCRHHRAAAFRDMGDEASARSEAALAAAAL